MPVMGGIEATEKILKVHPCCVLALTSYTAKEVHEQCLKVGMKEVFMKPVVSDMLAIILNKYYN